jgi:hypothetical protein
MKRIVLSAVQGALVGISLQYLLAIFISYKLNLGYLMAYVATLAEAVGGEMNAVMLEASLSGFLGMCVSLALEFAHKKAWSSKKRWITAGILLITGIIPAAVVTIKALQF